MLASEEHTNSKYQISSASGGAISDDRASFFGEASRVYPRTGIFVSAV
jgi:hypothetical protein